jgi:hypothetical protein
MVYAGYQDYFFSLFDDILTPSQTLNIVSDVVAAIVSAIEVSCWHGEQCTKLFIR